MNIAKQACRNAYSPGPTGAVPRYCTTTDVQSQGSNTKLRKSAFYYTFTREKPTCTTTVTPGKVCCRETGQDELYISDLPHLYARASFLGNSVARHAVGAQLINFDCPGSVYRACTVQSPETTSREAHFGDSYEKKSMSYILCQQDEEMR